MLNNPTLSAIDTSDGLQAELILLVRQINANTEQLQGMNSACEGAKAETEVKKPQGPYSGGFLSRMFAKKPD